MPLSATIVLLFETTINTTPGAEDVNHRAAGESVVRFHRIGGCDCAGRIRRCCCSAAGAVWRGAGEAAAAARGDVDRRAGPPEHDGPARHQGPAPGAERE